jgi:hypothetical protein
MLLRMHAGTASACARFSCLLIKILAAYAGLLLLLRDYAHHAAVHARGTPSACARFSCLLIKILAA